MKSGWLFVFGLACGVAVMAAPRVAAHLHGVIRGAKSPAGTQRAHTKEEFWFTAHAPMEQVAPLFGADKEREWSPHWNPQFLYPVPAADQQGMVFGVAHGHLQSVWVNTELDLKNGRIQYVYVIPDAVATVITLHLAGEGNQTQVQVEYERTALSADTDEHVRHLGEGDRSSGPEWDKQVNGYLEKVRGGQSGAGNP